MSLTDILFPVADFIFPFWPLILVSSVARVRRGFLRAALVIWAFLVVMRVFLLFNPNPLRISFLISEPLNTYLFLATGAVLLLVLAARGLWPQGGFRKKTSGIQRVEDIYQLTPREFEEMVTALYRSFGHSAKRTGATGDHGVDVVVRASNGEKWVAQCKRWRAPVGEPVVRDFYGVMQHEKADQGAIIATAGFTREARDWARGKPIILYDGKEFLKAWKRAKPQMESHQPVSEPMPVASEIQPEITQRATTAPPFCPVCGVPMVRRTAGRGEHQGKPFYGCPNYPRCREIVRVS